MNKSKRNRAAVPAGPSPARDELAGGEQVSTPAFWQDRRVVVTGGRGFLGSHVVDRLQQLGCAALFVPDRSAYDLTDPAAVRALYADTRPDIVLHLAAEVGGIGANRHQPGYFFYANLMMGALLIEEGRRHGLAKFVQVGTICAYPKHTPVPFREEELWNGYPDETNAPYGIAKKALLVQLQAYRAQYGLNGIYLLPVNLYGPRDNFDPATSHVIPALIRRMTEAREAGADEVVLWGSGRATREFMHVDDCARGLLLAAEYYDGDEPVNLGTGGEISIRELAALIAQACRYEGRHRYDVTQPDGQPRRAVDTTRAWQRFGFRAQVPFREGLLQTVRWYEAQASADPARATEL